MSSRRGKISFILILVVALPILLQFTHVLHHHVDLHSISHLLNIEHCHHHNHDSQDDLGHCDICEYDFASFNLTETIELSSYILIKFQIITDCYQSTYQLLNTSSNLLRGPPQPLA